VELRARNESSDDECSDTNCNESNSNSHSNDLKRRTGIPLHAILLAMQRQNQSAMQQSHGARQQAVDELV
jgi:hypothetical protein